MTAAGEADRPPGLAAAGALPAEVDSQPGAGRAMALVGAALFLTSLNFSVMFVAFDSIVDSFDSTEAAISWALTGFSIATGALMVPAGWLADQYGRKRILLIGLLVFVAGSALVAVAVNPVLLVVGRVVQACGLSMESISAMALLLDLFGQSRRSTVIGGIGAIGGAAAALGPTVGGLLLDVLGWRGTFALNIPVGLALALALHLKLRSDHRGGTRRAPPDAVGIAGLVLGSTGLALAVVKSSDWGIGSARILGALAGGVLALLLAVRRSRVHPNPILYLPLYRDRNFRVGGVLNLIVAGSFAGLYLGWVDLLIETWDYSLTTAGLALSMIPLIAGPLSVVAGRLADRYGHRAVILPGTALQVVAGVFMLTTVSAEPALWSVWLPMVLLYGTGVGLAHSACHAAAMVTVPADRLGIGGAMSRIAMDAGVTISVAFVIALTAGLSDPVAGTRRVATVLIGVGLAGMALSTQLHPPAQPSVRSSRRSSGDL